MDGNGALGIGRAEVRVAGIVQGVGFRPFVQALAARLGLAGSVTNDAQGVRIEVEGPAEALAAFRTALERDAPPLATVESVEWRPAAPTGARGFAIRPSVGGGARTAVVPPDTATCAACLAEVDDPTDRRFRHPFATCTDCGPRFTIVTGVPYDRPATTMADFPMCAACAAEYHDPRDRRHHAQPVCCPACGPTLVLTDACGGVLPGDPIDAAAAALRGGAVVAVKGLGGYHLAALAADEAAVAGLRGRKHREDKPFAVLAADLDAARRLCELDAAEATLLTSPAAPIVLAARRPGAHVAPSVAPRMRRLGVLLPPTALHHLLVRAVGSPIVLTSGNVSDEPIAHRDDDARARLARIADAFLAHDRRIATRADDSVAHVVAGAPQLIRRSRGYVPRPVRLPVASPKHVLACGAELKHTFCLVRADQAFVSHHIGDLEQHETYRAFVEGVEHLSRLVDVEPAVVAHDLHPEYLSTKHALELDGVELVGVQHHHAHVASCLADNGARGPVIGVAFDGTGYGSDGTVWGGELLVADLRGFERLGHLRTVPLPGGAAAIREPWRMAAAWVDAAFEGTPPEDLALRARHADRWEAVVRLARTGTNAPATSSAGRLFDAVAALAGVRDAVTYEGQAAIELEQAADPGEHGAYPLPWSDGDPGILDAAELVRAVVADVLAGTGPPAIAARFHRGLAEGVAAACRAARQRTGLSTVALSGGVFANALLTSRLLQRLDADGFTVLTHRQVPPNDGGISLGQAAVAAAVHADRT